MPSRRSRGSDLEFNPLANSGRSRLCSSEANETSLAGIRQIELGPFRRKLLNKLHSLVTMLVKACALIPRAPRLAQKRVPPCLILNPLDSSGPACSVRR
jgi:hypothetical protein